MPRDRSTDLDQSRPGAAQESPATAWGPGGAKFREHVNVPEKPGGTTVAPSGAAVMAAALSHNQRIATRVAPTGRAASSSSGPRSRQPAGSIAHNRLTRAVKRVEARASARLKAVAAGLNRNRPVPSPVGAAAWTLLAPVATLMALRARDFPQFSRRGKGDQSQPAAHNNCSGRIDP